MKVQDFVDRLVALVDDATSTSQKPAAEKPSEKEKVLAAGGWWPELTPEKDADTLRRMGIDPASGASKVPAILGPNRTIRVQAVNVANQARVLWFDPDLARLLGFKVPASNLLTPELQKELLHALAYRLLGASEDPAGRPVIEMIVDMYGGTGTGGNEGAGRAAFFPYLNAYDKGLRNTPLSKIASTDAVHTHGLELLREAGLEAVWGKVGSNLFTAGATQALAIIDIGDFVKWGEHDQERACLLIRVGSHARPAHAITGFANAGAHTKEVFVESARTLGLYAGTETKCDYKATALKMLDHHARAAAEQYRWRILHGAMSTSNMIFDAQMIDSATNMSQPRTAPIKALEHTQAFGQEHVARADELSRMYDALKSKTGAPAIDFRAEMNTRYKRHRALQYLEAMGFKEQLAITVQNAAPHVVREFDEVISALAALTNKSESTLMLYKTATGLSAADVFQLLGSIAAETWAAADGKVSAARIVELLSIDVHGGSKNERKKLRAEIQESAERLSRIFPKIFAAAESAAGPFYDSPEDMKRAVVQRAKFENRPIDAMSHERLNNAFQGAISGYRPDDPGSIQNFAHTIDGIAAESVRNVDALLAQGGKRRLVDGTVELERRTIAGVDYAVRIAPDGSRKVHVALAVRESGPDHLELADVEPHLRIHKNDIDKLVYHYTTDGWRELEQGWRRPNRVHGELDHDDERGLRIAFELDVEKGDVAHLEGVFHFTHHNAWMKDGASNFKGYSYAVPDDREVTWSLGQ